MKNYFVILLVLTISLKINAQSEVLQSLSMTSELLKTEIKYSVYLPDGYEKSKQSFPVVYLLNGFTGDETDWIRIGLVKDISDELKKSGAFVAGIRPGAATKKFLEYVVIRITFIGAVFLSSIAILPIVAQIFTDVGSLAVSGTSLLIVVSVIIDTAKQAESMLVEQNYDKYL